MWGGEEFALLLRGLDHEDAMVCAERLRGIVENAAFMEGNTRMPVTISLGLACQIAAYAVPDDLLRAADASLYRAKREGRNRVQG